MIKKTLSLLTALIMLMLMATSGYASEASDAQEKPLIGIAWCADTESEFFTNICRAIEETGGAWVMLEQVKSPDLKYTDQGKLIDCTDDIGTLTADAAKYVRCYTWHGSNAAQAVGDLNLIIFTGGSDISPSLYYTPEECWNTEGEGDYCAERDVSDYLTMTYCLDNDIPVIGFCRGMQMLSVVSGAEFIQDIPTYFSDMSLEYGYEHRNEPESADAYRDYASHDVQVDEDSLLYQIVKTTELKSCPSWHHQAVKDVDNTRLKVTGYTDTNGIEIVEAVERTDKAFAVGLQFHPEAAVIKQLYGAENADDYMDYDTALSIFEYLVWQVAGEYDIADAA